jgi:hypothetical protein
MTAAALADCTGLWRRTLLIEPDGSRDTGTDVLWLQAGTAYVDSRGFAGTLHRAGDTFEWHRDIDLGPPRALPDAGSMRWDGHTLVESGVYEDYVEHWVREGDSSKPSGALMLASAAGAAGLLLRVGATFGWAGGGEVVIDAVGTARWNALAIDVTDRYVQAKGARWTISRSEGDVNP